MNTVNTRTRTLGVNFNNNGSASIVLWAPEAGHVEILIVSRNIKIPLISEEYGYWILKTDILSPGEQYQFILNGEKQLPDPASLSQPEGVYGPSKAIDLKAFAWTDTNWKNIPLKEYITYELHTGTFTPEGTFASMEEKLDYLVDLGITAIEIMPVSQFSGERNWGYDGVFPFCVQNSYGGAEALQHLVNVCHQKGLAVILDVVYNHIGPEGNHLDEFAPYFTDKYHTPWGNAINFDDAWCDGVRLFFIENALMWFRDFHIDALRMDAVHAIKDFSPVHILQEIKEQVDFLEQQNGRCHYLIVELDLNDTRFINPTYKGGFGMSSQWIDEFHHSLRVSSGQEKSGYYSDFNGIKSLAKSYQDAYVYDGAYSDHRKKKFGMKAKENGGEQFVVFSQNHDHVGNRMFGERTSELVSFDMQKLMAGAVLVSPFLPLLFMGEEYSETGRFQYFVSHTDPELAEAVRKGRKREFRAFHMAGEAPDPMGEEAFLNSKLHWELADKAPHKTMLAYYKKLIEIRKRKSALYVLNRKDGHVECLEDKGVIVLQRQHKNQNVICLMNFSNQPREVNVAVYSPVWHKLIASSDVLWNGSEDLPETIPGEITLVLPSESFTLYNNQNE
ncbi:malto-oligosyltrehalose trehalohydrolase [Dyadobacter frigoris]|uniref:Malto-oligosyltrehalose trehalohydrolase n=1 Tax=Dyadobacter frigoris TaxID=2576211 RepID=A0A4U6D0R2_9BACT|nr:malto-oligosyltrehalose trehalohydrolase [Dyadobacter frigoris]TKT90769.1 malto-oligosyltrehalose trehalohydrolase [Dyadobacter frigoris]GLU52104.1 malto-oligosyltrehalose trehalohydrolase [Dyadobacter frigoris]